MTFLLTLTPAERRQARGPGVQMLRATGARLQAAREHRDSLPASFDLAQFEKDAALVDQLMRFLGALEVLSSRATDTLSVVGRRAIAAGAEAYGHIKATSTRTRQLKRTVEQLSMRTHMRPRTRRSKDDATSASATPAVPPAPAPAAAAAAAAPAAAGSTAAADKKVA